MIVVKEILQRGFSVPEDIAVVGFEDSPLATSSYPMLSSVRVELQEIGKESARMLFDLMELKEDVERKIVKGTELIVRETC
jgi:LacI family transcriptional regulator